jgi:hypothetical protein
VLYVCVGRATPTPLLPAITYPHTVLRLQPVELILDRVAGRWQFTVRCGVAGSFDEVTVEMKEPRGEASYKSALTGLRTCPGGEPPALTGGLAITNLKADEPFTLILTVTQRSSGGMSGTSVQRSYLLDAMGELHPTTR